MIPALRVDEKEKMLVNSEMCQEHVGHQGAWGHSQGVVSFVNAAEHRV